MSSTTAASSSSMVSATPRLHSMSTTPFDNDPDLSTKEGIAIWNATTVLDSSAERLDLIFDNGDKIHNLVNALVKKFRLAKYLRVPTEGSGFPTTTTRANGGAPSSANVFAGHKKLLDEYQDLTLDQVKAFSCYNWGGNAAEWIVTSPLACEDIDFTSATGYKMKRLKLKQQCHIHSKILFVALQNILSDKSMHLQMVKSNNFTFEDAK